MNKNDMLTAEAALDISNSSTLEYVMRLIRMEAQKGHTRLSWDYDTVRLTNADIKELEKLNYELNINAVKSSISWDGK